MWQGDVMAEDLIARAESLDVRYGPFRALFDVSIDLPKGHVVALLGPNGAGKSTLGRALSGLIPVTSGTIELEGKEVTGWPAHRRRQAGMAYIPEGRGIFPNLSVRENLWLVTGTGVSRDKVETVAFERFPILAERRSQLAGTLSGGEQQMLAIARALMSRPRLLMLDEPSLGLAPLIARQIFDIVRILNERDGLSVLLVEQNAYHALRLAHRAYVMVNGTITMTGTGAALLARPEVRAAYLEGGRS